MKKPNLNEKQKRKPKKKIYISLSVCSTMIISKLQKMFRQMKSNKTFKTF